MARYKSLLKIQGTLNDLTFYTYRGKQIVRSKTSLNREQVMNSPEFAASRKAMREFGAASVIGKMIRTSLAAWKSPFTDGTTVNRLSKNILKVIQASEGPKGERPFSPAGHEELLRGFEMHKTESLGKRYKAPLGIQYSLLADHLRIRFGALRSSEHLRAPKEATHYVLDAILLLLSDYHHNPETGKYEPTCPEENGRLKVLTLDWMPMNDTYQHFDLEQSLTGDLALKKGLSLCTFCTLRFGVETNGRIQALEEGAAMALVDVKAN